MVLAAKAQVYAAEKADMVHRKLMDVEEALGLLTSVGKWQ